MKRTLRIAGTLLLLAAPLLVNAAMLPSGTIVQRMSPRLVRERIRAQPVLNARMLSIQEVPLDRTFEQSDIGVTIQYPSSWSRQNLMQHTPPLTLVVMFLSPDQVHGVRENINLVTEDLPRAMALQDYTQLGIDMEKGFFDTYTLLSSKDRLVSGTYPGHTVTFTAQSNGTDMTFEQVWLLRGKVAHVWTFADDSSVFAKHIATFERMMDTMTVR